MSESILDTIDLGGRAIAAIYIPGAVAWVDKNMDGAWTKELEAADEALRLCITFEDYDYSRTIMKKLQRKLAGFVDEFKASKTKEALEKIKRGVDWYEPQQEPFIFEEWRS